MKKLFTLLFFTAAIFSFKIQAQTASNCGLQVSFISQSLGSQPNVVQFTSTSIGYAPGDTIHWTFGDGSASDQLNPLHTYPNFGTYQVCLIIRKVVPLGTTPCLGYSCHSIVAGTTSPCTLSASFTSQQSTSTSNGFYFTNTSTGFASGDSIRWNFGDGTFAYTPNAYHVYANPGTYNVCLWVKKNGSATTAPCISEICHTVTVTSVNSCNLQAYYSFLYDANQSNLVHFTNQSPGLLATDSVYWTFGDGSTSTDANPNHVYTANGTYTACIRIVRHVVGSTVPCVREFCKTIAITLPNPCNLHPSFTYTNGTSAGVVYFNNTSSGYATGDSVTWTFGDGGISHDYNTSHVYTAGGNYTVCLHLKRNTLSGTAPCIRDTCINIIVTLPPPCNLIAGFTWYRDTTVSTPNTYHFTNTSTPLNSTDSIRWTFGDGTSSNQANPNHVYAQPGTYNVCLRVQQRNNAGVLTSCVKEICHTVVVPQVCNLTPSFTWHADSLVFRKIYFTNTTITPTTNVTVTWYFGDGAYATSWNALHEYAQPGTYNVCLRLQYGTCVTYQCHTIIVAAPPVPCTQLANFHSVSTSANNTNVAFVPDNIYTDVQYTWTFGDGTGTHSVTASHQYGSPGYYTVCLTAYRNNDCAATSCRVIQVLPTVSCNNTTVSYTEVRDSLNPNKVKFTALANAPVLDQLWTITRIPATAGTAPVTIHSNNPTYIFADSGYYNVCLRATFAGGCIREYCRTIHILHPLPISTVCNLQVYPNPASGVINALVTLTQPVTLNAYIYNTANVLVAQKVQQGVVGSNTVSLNIATLPSGVYTFRLVYGNQVCYATFIKQI